MKAARKFACIFAWNYNKDSGYWTVFGTEPDESDCVCKELYSLYRRKGIGYYDTHIRASNVVFSFQDLIDSRVPGKGDGVRYERHDIDKMLLEYVDKIRAKRAISYWMYSKARNMSGAFMKIQRVYAGCCKYVYQGKELYQMVRKETKEIRLGNYCKILLWGIWRSCFRCWRYE